MGLCGGDTKVNMPPPPDAPDIGKATRDSMQAYIDLLPQMVEVEGRYAPQFADTQRMLQRGTLEDQYKLATQYAPVFNQLQTDLMRDSYDASIDAMMRGLEKQYDFDATYRPKYAQQELEMIQQFSDDYADQALNAAKRMTPQEMAIREMLGNQVQEDLESGSTLTDQQARDTEQSVRASQVARGNTLGRAPAAQEILGKFLKGEDYKNMKQGRAYNFLNSKNNNDFAAQAMGITYPQGTQSNVARQNPGFSAVNPMQVNSMATRGTSFDPWQTFQPMQLGQFSATNQHNNNVYNSQVQAAMTNAQMEANQPGFMGNLAGMGQFGASLGSAYKSFSLA